MSVDISGRNADVVRAIVYEVAGEEKRFLLVREPSGAYTLPGGYKLNEDADLSVAMARCLRETLGLTTHSCQVQETEIEGDDPDNIYADPESSVKKDIAIHLFVARYNGDDPIRTSDNVKSIIWLTEDNAKRLLTQEYMQTLFMHGLSYC